jgi:hypothetical protein
MQETWTKIRETSGKDRMARRGFKEKIMFQFACHEEGHPERLEGSVPSSAGPWLRRMLPLALSMTTYERS